MSKLGDLLNQKVEDQDNLAIMNIMQQLEEAWDREEKYCFARSRVK